MVDSLLGICFAVLMTGLGRIFAKVIRESSDMLRGSSLPKFRPVKTLALEKTLETLKKILTSLVDSVTLPAILLCYFLMS